MPKKILIVEDNPKNMRLIVMTLKARGYVLLEAADGDQALLKAMEEHPDLILMDVQLPGLSGLEVTGRLRQMPEFKSVAIVAISAHAMKGDRDRIIKAGCDGYLPKPIDTRELPGLVAAMLSLKREESACLETV